MTITQYTFEDIELVKKLQTKYRKDIAFRSNLIIELKENYQMNFEEIGWCLNLAGKTVKGIYYSNYERHN